MNQSANTVHKPSRLDAVAGLMSLLCAVHCLVLPIALPLLAPYIGNAWFEGGMMLTALVLGTLALRHGWRVHGFRIPTFLFAIGFSSLVIGNWVFTHGKPIASHSHSFSESPLQFYLVLVGAVLLVTAHSINLYLERRALKSGACC